MTDQALIDVWAQAHDRLRSLTSAHQLRIDELCDIANADTGIKRVIAGKAYLNFCSNDYLDLAHHPDVKQAAREAVDQYGTGTMASRLICGTLPIHKELEAGLAELKGAESCLVFSSGYMACLGVLQALSLRADDTRVPIIFDRLAHVSLVDGATQERRNWRSFPHNNLDSLELVLKKVRPAGWPSAIVVTEGIFSMDGDRAPLKPMSDLCEKYNAILLVDDAHGTGILGENGEGSAAVAGISGQPHVVQVGTLSKALGSQGGFVVGPQVLRDLMVNVSRTFIYDTGLNPAAAGAAIGALKVIREDHDRRKRFRSNVALFRKQLNSTGCDEQHQTPIIPVLLREEERAVQVSHDLREAGFLVAAIRPPTVPRGTSRLRVTITSAHHPDDIRRLAQAISMVETR